MLDRRNILITLCVAAIRQYYDSASGLRGSKSSLHISTYILSPKSIEGTIGATSSSPGMFALFCN